MKRAVTEQLNIIIEAKAKLLILQKRCKHKNFIATPGGNSGNWDPHDNCYWVDVKCLDCNTFMHLDSEDNKDLYNKYT